MALLMLAVLLPMTRARGAAAPTHPWDDATLGPDARATLVVRAMTTDEKLRLVFGYFATPWTRNGKPYGPPPQSRMGSAGYIPGIERLGIPPLWETDAGIGVATQAATTGPLRERTALPSGLATAATWNPALAVRAGAMIGSEARNSGFNVMLAGGINLAREPRNGRTFEYAGEDPLLAGTMVGAEIRGIQSNHIVATIKHFAMNDQETGRFVLDAQIAPDAARMSDLLAFHIAIEQGQPGAVMCAYNRVNGTHACENEPLLTQVLKRDWGFPGFVMSDWGATHSTVAAANAGLDQESGSPFDDQDYFAAPLQQAIDDGLVSRSRLDDMARRILYAMFAEGLVDDPVTPTVDPQSIDGMAHAAVTQADAEDAIVLLKNTGHLLPLAEEGEKIAVIGGHADAGVLAGGGSSLVYPVGGNAVPGLSPQTWPGPVVYDPSAPLVAMRARHVTVRFSDGSDRAAAAQLAAECAVAVVFVTQWNGESFDRPLTLMDNQDDLVAAVAAANPRTVVVVESGGAVLMPWAAKVGAIIEAWYPGTRGGVAIARVLFGEVDAAGRLPITFPQSEAQLPRPVLEPAPPDEIAPFTVRYTEGAAVGYKWFDTRGETPLFPFGHGLSYTQFAYGGLQAVIAGKTVMLRFTVKNIGERPGKAVPQVYVGPIAGGWEAPRRLVGWRKVALAPGETQDVSLTVDRRLLATYAADSGEWWRAAGRYSITLGASSRDTGESATIDLPADHFPESSGR